MFAATTEIERKSWDMTWNVAIETGGWLVSENVVLDIEAAGHLARELNNKLASRPKEKTV